MSQKKVALVLEGGGSLGAVQVGMLYALVRFGFRPDLVVGSSVGAINGAFYASAGSERCVERLEQVWQGMTTRTLFPFSLRHLMLAVAGKRAGFVSARGLENLVRSNVPYETLEEAGIPMHCVTTDLSTGLEHIISTGPAAEAIITSASIPGVFPPRRHGDRVLVDGGVASNAPVSVACELGATHIVVAPTGYTCAAGGAARSPISTLMQSMIAQNSRQMLIHIRRAHMAGIDVQCIPPLCPLGVRPYDFSRTQELINQAEETTRTWLEAGGLETPPGLVPHQIIAHLHNFDGEYVPLESLDGVI